MELGVSPLESRDGVVAAPARVARTRSPGALLRDYADLSKARLSLLVVLTAAAGFYLAAPPAASWALLGWTLAGTALAAFGVNALNQWLEADRDARMLRTADRPIPAGRVSRGAALGFGLALSLIGPSVLLAMVNGLTALLCLACQLIYIVAYTPLKTRSPLNTLVGAVCGAIPPMMGWAAASGGLTAGAWILAAILFVWQIPHFLALAWMYREDYERGGFQMLPSRDPEGWMTSRVIVLYSVALLPISMLLSLSGATGGVYAVGALMAGVGFVVLAARLDRRRSAGQARQVFLASIIYLPILLALMAADRGSPTERALFAVGQRATPSTAAPDQVTSDSRLAAKVVVRSPLERP